jgi:Ca2+-binding RTX toxin-like protein
MRKLLFIVGSAAMLALAGPAFADSVTGTAGNDTLVGTPTADTIRGLAGDDSAWGRRGADVIQGGAGDDKLQGMRGRDRITGGAGADALYGQGGKDTLSDAQGIAVDTLYGGRRADRIFANYRDTVFAGGGDDHIEFVYPSTAAISCGPGEDTVIFNQPYPDVTLYDCEHVETRSAG